MSVTFCTFSWRRRVGFPRERPSRRRDAAIGRSLQPRRRSSACSDRKRPFTDPPSFPRDATRTAAIPANQISSGSAISPPRPLVGGRHRVPPRAIHAAVPSPPHRPAPGWRREPYRLLFPLGAVLAVIAVLPFPLRGVGGGALGLFHSVAQILGFLTCFVLGFLFTFVPRRTHTAGPEGWEMAVAMGVPPAAVWFAWANAGEVSYLLWLGLIVVAIGFTVTRMRASAARDAVPAVLTWIPLSLAAGAVGAALAAAGPLLTGGGAPRSWAIGRGLLVQGLVAGLVIGVGGILVPQITRGDASPAPLDPEARRRTLGAHAAAAAAFFASFPLEVLVDVRAGIALRAAVCTLVLVVAARLHRPPTLAGFHRWLVWLGAWLVPLGFWIGALFPRHRGAALHVVFVGGFSQIALAVATHVALSHGGRPERLSRNPRALLAMAVLLAAAFVARIAAGIDLAHVAGWLSVAGVAFTGAVLAWAVVVGPVLMRGAGSGPGRR